MVTAWESLGAEPACLFNRYDIRFDVNAMVRTDMEILAAMRTQNAASLADCFTINSTPSPIHWRWLIQKNQEN